jgi:four helix bundle protein
VVRIAETDNRTVPLRVKNCVLFQEPLKNWRDSVRHAACNANIAEGFRRFGAPDFAKFLEYAYSSAGETRNWLDDGVVRKHWTESDIAEARLLLRRLDPGLTGLMRYLRSAKGRGNAQRISRSQPSRSRRRT